MMMLDDVKTGRLISGSRRDNYGSVSLMVGKQQAISRLLIQNSARSGTQSPPHIRLSGGRTYEKA